MGDAKTHWLYRLTPTRLAMLTEGPTDAERAGTQAHFAYLQGLLAEGQLVIAGRTSNNDETTFGIAIIEVEDEAEARRIMEGDPAIERGVMQGELFPYRIALER